MITYVSNNKTHARLSVQYIKYTLAFINNVKI